MDALEIKNIFWEKEWKIPKTSWTIRGYSRSAYRTGFYIPELRLMLDAGPQNFNKPENILITHGHADHIANLPLTLIGDNKGNHVFNVYGPEKMKEYLEKYIKSMFSLNSLEKDLQDINEWYKFNGLYPCDIFKISSNKTDLEIEVFECDHRVPTVSYGISVIKDKLKKEYSDLKGQYIATLKKSGTIVTEKVSFPTLAYVCDTSIEFFTLNPGVFKYPVIFIECTFILPEDIEQSISTKHIHWSQLEKYVIEQSETIFVLFHFSQKYRDSDIQHFFYRQRQIPNIFCWINISRDNPDFM